MPYVVSPNPNMYRAPQQEPSPMPTQSVYSNMQNQVPAVASPTPSPAPLKPWAPAKPWSVWDYLPSATDLGFEKIEPSKHFNAANAPKNNKTYTEPISQDFRNPK